MSRTRLRPANIPIIIGFCLLVGACTGKSVPGTVSKLELAPSATITAVSLGRDVYLDAAPNDILVVIGYSKGMFRTSYTWAVARIPEATATL